MPIPLVSRPWFISLREAESPKPRQEQSHHTCLKSMKLFQLCKYGQFISSHSSSLAYCRCIEVQISRSHQCPASLRFWLKRMVRWKCCTKSPLNMMGGKRSPALPVVSWGNWSLFGTACAWEICSVLYSIYEHMVMYHQSKEMAQLVERLPTSLILLLL